MRYGVALPSFATSVYARTSTDDQTTALQLAALKRALCSSIFEDKGLSGVSVKRAALSRCLKTLRAGDMLLGPFRAWHRALMLNTTSAVGIVY
jgi:hypothetical protein